MDTRDESPVMCKCGYEQSKCVECLNSIVSQQASLLLRYQDILEDLHAINSPTLNSTMLTLEEKHRISKRIVSKKGLKTLEKITIPPNSSFDSLCSLLSMAYSVAIKNNAYLLVNKNGILVLKK